MRRCHFSAVIFRASASSFSSRGLWQFSTSPTGRVFTASTPFVRHREVALHQLLRCAAGSKDPPEAEICLPWGGPGGVTITTAAGSSAICRRRWMRDNLGDGAAASCGTFKSARMNTLAPPLQPLAA
jgi:hypothetical protein